MDILIEGNIHGIGNVLTIIPENIAFTKITKSSLRLIVNETAGKVLYRHMAHDNITDISYDNKNGKATITFASSVPAMSASDVFSIKLYVQKEDIIPTDYAKETTAQQAATDAAEAKMAAQAITGYALQGSGNTTQTDIANAIGTPASGQPSTLFAAIAVGGGNEGGDARESTSQAILAAITSGNTTAIAELLNTTYGLEALRTLISAIPTTTPATPQNVTDAKDTVIAAIPDVSGLATETNATVNKNQVLNMIGNTLSVNMLATGLSAMAGVPMHVITDDGITTYTLNANELYYFNSRSSDLELTLNLATVNQGEAADFHLIVQVTAGPLTVTIKDSNNNDVVWAWNYIPDFSSGIEYEIGIINNLALYTSYVV